MLRKVSQLSASLGVSELKIGTIVSPIPAPNLLILSDNIW